MKNKIMRLLAIFFVLTIFLNTNKFEVYAQSADAEQEEGINLGGSENQSLEGIGGWTVKDGVTLNDSGAGENLENILSTVVGFLTILTGMWFVITFIVGGLGWATAGGDTANVDKAKQKMTNAAIGLIIVVAAYSITVIISKVLGLNILNPGSELEKLNQ